MKQKYAIWGFAGAAFLVTLGIMSWRNGLWSSDEPSAQSDGAAASHSINTPNPIPKDPFHAAMNPPAAPPPSQTTQSPPLPSAGTALSPPRAGQSTAPDPIYEQAQDDYKEREKLMEEIAARARAPRAQ